MTNRRILMFFVSIAVGALLILILVRLARVDLGTAVNQLRAAKGFAVAKLLLLNAVLIFLSTEKWRHVDAALRSTSDAVPSRAVCFVLTSIGLALGFALPVQFGMAAARTIGTHFYGKPLRRGMVGTMFEQCFDVFIVGVLALASVLTLLTRGGARVWVLSAIVVIVLACVLAGSATRLSRRIAAHFSSRMSRERRLAIGLKALSELEESGVLSARLARRLILLSALRFGVVVLMAGQTAAAVSAQIPLWKLAAAMPLVVLATALAITPGGIGVTELTYTGALKLFGTSTSIAASWSIANRILCMSTGFTVAIIASVVFLLKNLTAVGRGKKASELETERVRMS
jgi:uncharacterized membrane protein YbhN (UPF0104 family)